MDENDMDSDDMDSGDMDSGDMDSGDMDQDDMDPSDDEFPELESEMYESAPPFEEEEEDELTQINEQKDDTTFEKVDLSKVSLDLHLEVGKMKVSLEELQKMQPGSKLPGEINPRIVHLTVGGKAIGRGELVEVGETIGVKIIELY